MLSPSYKKAVPLPVGDYRPQGSVGSRKTNEATNTPAIEIIAVFKSALGPNSFVFHAYAD